MPIKDNAKKALKQAKKRFVKNLVIKKKYKSAIKDVEKALAKGEKDLASKLRLAQQMLDKAAKQGVIKKNAAGRNLSKLMKKVQLAARK